MTANEVGLLEYNRALKEDQNVTTKILRIHKIVNGEQPDKMVAI